MKIGGWAVLLKALQLIPAAATILTDMFTRQISQNLEVGNGKNCLPTPEKSASFFSPSCPRETWQASHYFPKSEEFEVVNGKNCLHPKNPKCF